MNPIALLAFIAGINTTTTTAPEPRQPERPGTTQETKPLKDDQGNGAAKRGGWDRN